MSESSIALCAMLAGAQRIHTFLELSICVERGDAMLLLFWAGVGRITYGFFESYRCFVALLFRDLSLVFVISAYGT